MATSLAQCGASSSGPEVMETRLADLGEEALPQGEAGVLLSHGQHSPGLSEMTAGVAQERTHLGEPGNQGNGGVRPWRRGWHRRGKEKGTSTNTSVPCGSQACATADILAVNTHCKCCHGEGLAVPSLP